MIRRAGQTILVGTSTSFSKLATEAVWHVRQVRLYFDSKRSVQMLNTELEYRERIRKLAVCIVKHYRGKGPDNVKVSLNSPLRVTVEIQGTLSNLSEILVHEGAVEKVSDYWNVLRPYLEKEFMREAEKTLGSPFTYTWEVCPSVHGDGHIIITLELQHIPRLD
ncbi:MULTISPECIES: DUF2294 domain-containing protein [Paenibacillus]|uniref:DUF2294 domain-containing protein n=1 Tax=Paenibacillus TaxID=44249 RepID=UPI001F2E24DA|nr:MULTISPECIES: DUF2294 domain-containing protein [Paenibacillus]MDN4087901.1 DUF2294 domain-containing protein [Paenibacillus polymyxa]